MQACRLAVKASIASELSDAACKSVTESKYCYKVARDIVMTHANIRQYSEFRQLENTDDPEGYRLVLTRKCALGQESDRVKESNLRPVR